MTETKFYTVVYEVQKGHHDEWWGLIQPMFLTDDKPISVTCVSCGDLIDQLKAAAKDAENHG